jgi:hypothetical protein
MWNDLEKYLIHLGQRILLGISVGLMGGCGLGCWGMAAMIKAGSN